MTLYRYATLMRPACPGAIPTDKLHACEDLSNIVTPSGHHAYSIADYERELSKQEVADYELEFMHKVEL